MFVQVIEGRVKDRDGLRRQMDRWMTELRPGAEGFLGATGGVADDGHGVSLVRFESAEAARANSERPEQGQWWSETEQCYEGDVTFTDSDDVETWLGGGSDDAGFVQVMKSGGLDRGRLGEFDRLFEEHVTSFRPDIMGGIRVWIGPDSVVEANYFTGEAEAREGEQKEPPAEIADAMSDFQELMADTEFIDLTDPWLY